MRIRFYINFVRFVSNFSVLLIKTIYLSTFFFKSFKVKKVKKLNFLNLGNTTYGKMLLQNVVIIDGAKIYLPDYIYEIDTKDSFAKSTNIIQLWDLGGLPIHSEKSIHSFDWLYDLRSINSTISRKIAISWILEWVARYGSGKGPGWSIEVASKRAISLVENNDLFEKPPFGGEEPYNFLNEKVRTILSRTLYLIRIVKPISFSSKDQFFIKMAIFYCEYFRGAETKILGQFIQGIGRESKRLINKHGEIDSRNPEELLEFLVYLEKLRNYGRQLKVYGAAEGSFIDVSVMRAAKTLKAVRFENGRLVAAMGSDGGSEPYLNVLSSVEYPKEVIRDGIYMGFCKLRAKNVTIIADVSEPPKYDRRGTAHAGLLSFEFASGLRKIIVNCGSGHRHDSYIERQNRSTYAHSTLELADQSQAQFIPVWPRSLRPEDKMFRRSQKTTKVLMEENQKEKTLISEHNCYESRFGIIHKRQFKLTFDGQNLSGSDELIYSGFKNKKTPYRLYFHLHPDVEAWHLETNKSVILKLKNGETWLFTHKGGDLSLAESAYFGRGDINVRESKQIVVSSNKKKYRELVEWKFQNQTSRSGNLRDIGLENIG